MRFPWSMRNQWDQTMLRSAPVGAGSTAGVRPGAGRAARPNRADVRHMAEELASESAAYVTGTYAEALTAHNRMVPAWGWTNLLAHGTAEELRRQAQALDEGRLHARMWLAARGFLAAEILERVDRGAELSELQRDVLVPLEHDLMLGGRSPLRGGLSVTDWVAEVRAALSAHDAVVAHGGGTTAA